VTVITREELALSAARTLEEVLLEVPGISFLRNVRSGSAHPSFQSVSLRGLGGTAASRTLVLVDGVPLNDGYFGWVRWDQVPVETIERIEIVRGGGSTVWGSQSLAGVIQIITRDPSTAGLSMGSEGGSQSTFRGDAMGTFGNEAVSGFVAAEYFDSDGYILTTPKQRGLIDVPSSSDHVALRGKVTIDASEKLKILATGSYYDEDKINATRLRPNSTKTGFGQIGLRAGDPQGGQFGVNVFGQAQAYANAISSVGVDRDSETPALNQFDIPSRAIGGDIHWSRANLGAHALSVGADIKSIHGEAFEDFLFRNDSFQNRRHTGGDQLLAGIYLEDRIHLDERLDVTGGVRLDIWNNTGGFREISEIETGDVNTDLAFADRARVHVSENVGLRLHVSERVSLRGSVYTGLRIPTLNELYKPFRASGGIVNESNAALDPERLFGFEGGVDFQLGRRWLARATGFFNRVTDAILDATILEVDQGQRVDPCGFVPSGGACRQRMNVGTIRSIGLETQLEFRPTPTWVLAATFDVTPNEITAAKGREEIVGNRPPRSARAQGTIRLGYVDPSTIEAAIIGRYNGTQFENDLNTRQIDDSFVIDMRLARQITPTLMAYATVQNLFDTEWQISNETTLTRIGAPRTLIGGLRFRVAGAAR